MCAPRLGLAELWEPLRFVAEAAIDELARHLLQSVPQVGTHGMRLLRLIRAHRFANLKTVRASPRLASPLHNARFACARCSQLSTQHLVLSLCVQIEEQSLLNSNPARTALEQLVGHGLVHVNVRSLPPPPPPPPPPLAVFSDSGCECECEPVRLWDLNSRQVANSRPPARSQAAQLAKSLQYFECNDRSTSAALCALALALWCTSRAAAATHTHTHTHTHTPALAYLRTRTTYLAAYSVYSYSTSSLRQHTVLLLASAVFAPFTLILVYSFSRIALGIGQLSFGRLSRHLSFQLVPHLGFLPFVFVVLVLCTYGYMLNYIYNTVQYSTC